MTMMNYENIFLFCHTHLKVDKLYKYLLFTTEYGGNRMNNDETRTIEIEYTQTLPELEQRAKDLIDDFAQDDDFEHMEDAQHEVAVMLTPIHYNELIGVWYDWSDEFEGYTKEVFGEYHDVDTIHGIIQSDLYYYLKDVAWMYGDEQGYYE